MSRSTEDGRHEMWIMHLFADGSGGGGWHSGKLSVLYRPDGTRVPYAEQEHRDPVEVVGWQAVCEREGSGEIHWHGPPWTRVPAPFAWAADNRSGEAVVDPGARTGFSTDGYAEDADDLGSAITKPWDDHIRPTLIVRPVELAADECTQAQQRLADAVRQARLDGADWESISEAAGMTPAGAEEHWGDRRRV